MPRCQRSETFSFPRRSFRFPFFPLPMKSELLVLIAEAIGVYFLVLWAHSLRQRAGLAHFYALIGSLTAGLSRVTSSGDYCVLPHFHLMHCYTGFSTPLVLWVFIFYIFYCRLSTLSTILNIPC